MHTSLLLFSSLLKLSEQILFPYKEVDVRLNNIYRGREFSYQDLKKINIGEIVKEYKVLFIVLEM